MNRRQGNSSKPRRFVAGLEGLCGRLGALSERSGLLLTFGGLFSLLLLLSLKSPWPVLTLDDVTRTALAMQWANEPYFFTWDLVWLPFPMMLSGTAMGLTGETFVTALVVNILAMGVAVAYVFRLTAARFGGFAAWFAASAFALSPWVGVLALSRLSDAMVLAALSMALFHWLRFQTETRASDLALASAALSAAVLTRYEVWPLALVLSGGLTARVVALCLRHRWPRTRLPWATLVALSPGLLMGVWVAKNLATYGVPLYGGVSSTLLPAEGTRRAIRILADYCWDINPLLLVAGALGCLLYLRQMPVLCGALGLQLAVLWYLVAFTGQSRVYPIRLALLPLMLVAPFAGGFAVFLGRAHRAAFAVAALAIVALFVSGLAVQSVSAPPPATLLALRLVQDGRINQFDAIYIQDTPSASENLYRWQVFVATSARLPIEMLPTGPLSAPSQSAPLNSVLVIGDGEAPALKGAEGVFLVSKVDQVSAWGVCSGHSRSAYGVEWQGAKLEEPAKAGQPALVRLAIRNTSSWNWHQGLCGVSIAYRWQAPNGVSTDWTVLPLAREVRAGGTGEAVLPVEMPAVAGAYVLQIELMHDHVGSFSSRGGSAFALPVQVHAAGPKG